MHARNQAAMDVALSQILDACNLVNELEHMVGDANALSDTRLLLESCEAIVAAFERPIPLLRYQLVDGERRDASMRGEADGAFFRHVMESTAVMPELGGGFTCANDPAVGAAAGGGAGGKVGPAREGASSGRRPAVQKPQRKRKERATAIRIRMPLPGDWDKDIPPYDGYMWRKYGRKDILNSTFQRNYYRCTYKMSHYGCEAKKYVQRLDEDPEVCEVMYIGEHTCNISQTPLSIPPFAMLGVSGMGYDLMNPQPGAAALTPQHTETQLPLGSSICSFFQMEQQRPTHERDGAVQTLFISQGWEASRRAGGSGDVKKQ